MDGIVEEAMADASVPSVLEWCRAPESRLCWPGVRSIDARSGDLVLFYDVEFHLPGAEPSTLMVEEHLTPPIRLSGDETEFETASMWAWPDGRVATVSLGYRLRSVSEGTRLQVTLRYLLPRTIGERIRGRAEFEEAVRRVLAGYVRQLAGHVPARR